MVSSSRLLGASARRSRLYGSEQLELPVSRVPARTDHPPLGPRDASRLDVLDKGGATSPVRPPADREPAAPARTPSGRTSCRGRGRSAPRPCASGSAAYGGGRTAGRRLSPTAR